MSIVERLREYAVRKGHRKHVTYMDAHGAANLIEQQAERIKELEARNLRITDMWAASCNELRSLRQRIADAPVVGWQAQSGFCYPSKRFDSDEPLISKEDLQK